MDIKLLVRLTLAGWIFISWAQAAPFNVHLSWDDNQTATSMAVTWNTNGNEASEIKYGLTSDYGETETGTSWSSKHRAHSVKITGLEPSTVYHYSVGSDADGWSDDAVFITGPELGSGREFKFAAIGDYRSHDNSPVPDPEYEVRRKAVQDAMMPHEPEFVLGLGDYVCRGPVLGEWDEWFSDLKPSLAAIPYMPSIGNHEVQPNNRWDEAVQLYRDLFTIPGEELYYSWKYGNAWFIAVEVKSHDNDVGNAHRDWVETELQAASADEDIIWKIAYMHSPLYCGSGCGNDQAANVLSQLFDQYGLDIAFTAHDHMYERSHFIKDGEIIAQAPSGSVHDEPEGTLYVVSGGGGAPGGPPSPGYLTGAHISDSSPLHFSLVSINGGTLKLEAINAEGEVKDDITITREFTVPVNRDLPEFNRSVSSGLEMSVSTAGDEGRVEFSVSVISPVTLTLFSSNGKFVKELYNNVSAPETRSINFDVSSYPTGLYYVRAAAGADKVVRKFVLMQ